MSEGGLSKCVKEFVSGYVSYRDAANAIGVDHGYLHRLANGQAFNPSEDVLAKMGIRRTETISYKLVKS